MPSTWNEGGCRQVPGLPRKVPRRHGRLTAPKRAARASPAAQVPRLPRKTKVDGVWQSCVWKMVCDKVWKMGGAKAACDKDTCEESAWKSCVWKRACQSCVWKMVCDKVVCVCDRVVCQRGGWRRRRQHQEQEPQTQRCRGKQKHLITGAGIWAGAVGARICGCKVVLNDRNYYKSPSTSHGKLRTFWANTCLHTVASCSKKMQRRQLSGSWNSTLLSASMCRKTFGLQLHCIVNQIQPLQPNILHCYMQQHTIRQSGFFRLTSKIFVAVNSHAKSESSWPTLGPSLQSWARKPVLWEKAS